MIYEVKNSGRMKNRPELLLSFKKDHQIIKLRGVAHRERNLFLKLDLDTLKNLFTMIESIIIEMGHDKVRLSLACKLFEFFQMSDIISYGNGGLGDLTIVVCPVVLKIDNHQLQNVLVRNHHINIHGGKHNTNGKTYEMINQSFFWDSMYEDVREFARNCWACRKRRRLKYEISCLERELKNNLEQLFELEIPEGGISQELAAGVVANV